MPFVLQNQAKDSRSCRFRAVRRQLRLGDLHVLAHERGDRRRYRLLSVQLPNEAYSNPYPGFAHDLHAVHSGAVHKMSLNAMCSAVFANKSRQECVTSLTVCVKQQSLQPLIKVCIFLSGKCENAFLVAISKNTFPDGHVFLMKQRYTSLYYLIASRPSKEQITWLLNERACLDYLDA